MKIWKYLSTVFFVACVSISGFTQQVDYAKQIVEDLSAPNMYGRGYYKNGVNKAGKYIANEMKEMGLESFEKNYFQNLKYDVNTFPNNTFVALNGKKLEPGSEYMVSPDCPKVKRDYQIVSFDSITYNDTLLFTEKISTLDLNNKLVVIDFTVISDREIRMFYILKQLRENSNGAAGFIEKLSGNLVWSVRSYQKAYPIIKIQEDAFPEDLQTISINVRPKLKKDFKTSNVIGSIPSATNSNEWIIFTAHYDHLGHMGKEMYIPGAQDNASGTSMVLNLAKHYSENPADVNIAFMLFTGEEIGLLGSTHYVFHPYFPIENIRAVVNLDMVGTGDKGITVVNGGAEGYQDLFSCLDSINIQNKYFTILKARGEAANSDHYPFHMMGRKAIFIYTMGGTTYYHNPKDKPETLSYTGYNALFNLLLNFVDIYE